MERIILFLVIDCNSTNRDPLRQGDYFLDILYHTVFTIEADQRIAGCQIPSLDESFAEHRYLMIRRADEGFAVVEHDLDHFGVLAGEARPVDRATGDSASIRIDAIDPVVPTGLKFRDQVLQAEDATIQQWDT